MRTLLILLLLTPSAAFAQRDAVFDAARNAIRRAYASRNVQEFELALEQLASDDSVRAVNEILLSLELAEQLDAYQPAVRYLARMKNAAARARILHLAADAGSWEKRTTALEAASYWDEGEALVIKALDARHALLVGHARRLVAEMGSIGGVSRLIAQFEQLTAANAHRRREGKTLHTALRAASRKHLKTAAEYRTWWSGLSFMEKERWLATGRRPPLVKPADGGGSAEAPRRKGTFSPLMEAWRRRRPDSFEYLSKLAKRDIVVVTGYYDKIHNVLKHLGIEHTLISRASFHRQLLNPRQVLIFNCTHTAKAAQLALRMMGRDVPLDQIPVPSGKGGRIPKSTLFRMLSDAEIAKIRTFVNQGGYLFTSDWELANVLTRAFPRYVGIAGQTDKHIVEIEPLAERMRHPLLRDVFPVNPYLKRTYRWHIDPRSFLIKIKHPEVVTLAVSRSLKTAYGNDLVAVTFRPTAGGSGGGAGRVLHVLGHFHKQRDAETDSYALQKMLLNFISLKKQDRLRRK